MLGRCMELLIAIEAFGPELLKSLLKIHLMGTGNGISKTWFGPRPSSAFGTPTHWLYAVPDFLIYGALSVQSVVLGQRET